MGYNPFSLSAMRVLNNSTGFGAEDQATFSGVDFNQHSDPAFRVQELYKRFEVHQQAQRLVAWDAQGSESATVQLSIPNIDGGPSHPIRCTELVGTSHQTNAMPRPTFLRMDRRLGLMNQAGLNRLGPSQQWALARMANASQRRADTFSALRQLGLIAFAGLIGTVAIKKSISAGK